MTNIPHTEEILKEFDDKFLYWVVLGSTMNDGSELRWNVGEDQMPSIEKIKSFILLALSSQRKQIAEWLLQQVDGEDEQIKCNPTHTITGDLKVNGITVCHQCSIKGGEICERNRLRSLAQRLIEETKI